MKKVAASLLITFIAATAQAGSFGGPPPFTNGSPLPTGNDGLYAASAHGKNVNGIFRFAFSSGAQTTSVLANSYFFFVAGQVYFGDVQAMIGEGSVSGVLEESASNNSITANGYFSGKIDQQSAYGSFSGKGKMSLVNGSSSSSSTTTTTTTTTIVDPDTTTVTVTENETDSSANEINILTEVKFKYNGVRTLVSSN